MFAVCVIAILNLCLGFVVAIRLGYGPPSVSASWQVWLGQTSAVADSSHAGADNGELGIDHLAISEEDLESLMDEDPEEDLLADAMQDGDPMSSESDEVQSPAEANTDNMFDPNAPENWDLNEKFVETSVLKLNIAMMKSGARAVEIDSRLRACGDAPDLETIRVCAGLLKEDCESYLAEQEEATEKMRDRLEEFGDLKSLAEGIELSNMEQAAQIETTLNNLAFMDLESDLEAALLRLLEELSNLREARHKLRDGQNVVFLRIAKSENRVDKIHKPLFNDPLTGVRSRVGLEATIHEWWESGKHKTRQMNASLFDMDNFHDVNKQHGPAIGDKALADVGQFMDNHIGNGDLLGRHAGQRFLLITLDKGPRAAGKDAEFLRQSTKRTVFEADGVEFNLTMCGGYTEIKPEDTPEGFLERLEMSLKKAKAEGPNHAFFHDGREAEIVESPDLRAKDRKVKLSREGN
ncbi:MAG: GGDEF domain-containing protein [Planctomycetota bacterium]|nr:GGDEF domain-containing protein [Planctomycetota bacterium]